MIIYGNFYQSFKEKTRTFICLYTSIDLHLSYHLKTYTCESEFFVISISILKMSNCKCEKTFGERGVGSSLTTMVY